MLFSSKSQPEQANWARTVAFCPQHYVIPHDVDELRKIVRDAAAKGLTVRVIGSGHSFSPVAACDDILVSLDKLQGLIKIDKARKQACFYGGTKLFLVGPLLKEHGLALTNMGDIDQQSLAGALQTGTHGTGLKLGCLSSFVTELTLLLPNGELLTCNAETNREIFSYARLALGTLGIVVTVTMQCMVRYTLEDKRWPIPLDDGLRRSDDLAASSRHFEFFWFPYTKQISAKTLNIVDIAKPRNKVLSYVNDHVLENTVFKSMCNLSYHHNWLTKSINRLSAAFLPTAHYADESFKVFPSARNVKFSEMEFAIPIEKGQACFHDIRRLIEKSKLRISLPIEYRYVAGDDIPLSPFYGRTSVTISLHAYRGLDQQPYFDAAQEIFLKYAGRPHWGKMHRLKQKQLAPLLSGMSSFQKCRRELDPNGVFLTPYLRDLLL